MVFEAFLGFKKMKEIVRNLFTGDLASCWKFPSEEPEGALLHACREPCHRLSLEFDGEGQLKNPDDRHFVRYERELFLNIIDSPAPKHFNRLMFSVALKFIDEMLSAGRPTLIHCNEGVSRAPSITLLYLAKKTGAEFLDLERSFRKLYPPYRPKNGIRSFILTHWREL